METRGERGDKNADGGGWGWEGNWCLQMNEAGSRIRDRKARVTRKTMEEGHSLASGICSHVCD